MAKGNGKGAREECLPSPKLRSSSQESGGSVDSAMVSFALPVEHGLGGEAISSMVGCGSVMSFSSCFSISVFSCGLDLKESKSLSSSILSLRVRKAKVKLLPLVCLGFMLIENVVRLV